ncbi:hypothetical protein Bca52824_004446 [Brassica carinata]|uniref:Uncharacterized protein n=1 Tax=Brassica carinata TaxID=52824 RepID=A0A8X7WP00_BRACI|nr:hypothetical protein Bca52824_004446 [Brassica carinata]
MGLFLAGMPLGGFRGMWNPKRLANQLEVRTYKLMSVVPLSLTRGLRAADKCCVREMILEIDGGLASRYRMPVTLKLSKVILEDICSSISFPSLKTLSLLSVECPGDEFVSRLLSSCHVLEVLHVVQCPSENGTSYKMC